MKKPPYKLITTSLVCTVIFCFIGCSDMLSKFDSIQWGTTYTVRHLLQDLNRDGTGVEVGRYTEDLYERETLVNTVPNTLSEAKVKEIPGFTPTVTNDDIEQVIVNGDGSTTIDIYYDRNPVTLTFDPNGGYFVVEDGNTSKQSEEPIEITQVYGTTVSLPKPKFDSDESIKVSLYNLVPVSGSTKLNASSDDMFIKFPVPPTSGTYRALWDVTTDIANISKTTQIPSGKLKLTGAVNTKDIKNLKNALGKSEVELDLAGLTINEESLTIGSDQNQGIMNPAFDFLKNLTKVTLPKTGKIKLGLGAFSSCPNLESITIGSNVEVLHGGAFWGSTQLHFEVDSNHPSLVATSDGTALLRKISDESEEYSLVSYPSASGNINLGKLEFTITAIEEEALALLPDGNTTITFPATVKVIGPYADYQKNQGAQLTIIMEGTEPPMLGADPFGDISPLIYVPDGSEDTYKKASGWSNYKTNIRPMSDKPQ